MSQPLDQATVRVRIVEGHFLIEDEDAHWPTIPDFQGPDDWLLTTDNQIAVCSASGEWHIPEALLQHWATTPPAPGPDWPLQQEALCHFASGGLNIWNPAREEIFGTFDLKDPGTYHVRAYTANRDNTRQAIEDAAVTAGDQPIRGIEKFLIQFWPAASETNTETTAAAFPMPDWLDDVAALEQVATERRKESNPATSDD